MDPPQHYVTLGLPVPLRFQGTNHSHESDVICLVSIVWLVA
jgi:hypothetical protein